MHQRKIIILLAVEEIVYSFVYMYILTFMSASKGKLLSTCMRNITSIINKIKMAAMKGLNK